jgi:hypothetical protein
LSIVTLLTPPPMDDSPQQSAWEFELSMAQRTLLGAMAPLSQYSPLPYDLQLSPMDPTPAGSWLMSLQQATDNAMNALPSAYAASTLGFALQNYLVDSNLTDPANLAWWTFVNSEFLQTATATVAPYPAYPELNYPFW